MTEIAIIKDSDEPKDLYELMKYNGDMVQVDGIWIPVDKPKCSYIYQQKLNKYGVLVYYYTDFKSMEQAIESLSNEKSNNFGEVVMSGELFCVTGPLVESYTHIAACVIAVLTELIRDVYVIHTEYPSDSGKSVLHIFRVKKDNKFLYWNIADMHKIMSAVCHHIDRSTGQNYGEMYTKVNDYLFKPIIDLEVYTPMKHMILPGCINLENGRSYKMHDSAISRHIGVNINDNNWELCILPNPVEEYDRRLAIASKEIFDQVMEKYGIEIRKRMPWPCEHIGHVKKCPNDEAECSTIVRITPHDLKAFYKCKNSIDDPPTSVVLHRFEHNELQVRKDRVVEVFSEYLNLNHHAIHPTFAIQSLKRVLVYDLDTKKIAIKKKNIETQEIYWEYYSDDVFFTNYTRKVRNIKGKFGSLKDLITDYAHEFKATLVWVPYSWKYKPDNFSNYSTFVNQYPKPREPQNNIVVDFPSKISALFKDDSSMHIFIMFMAMVIQKPHQYRKFHLVLHNGCLETIVPLCIALLSKEVVRVTRIEQIQNIPQCTLCVVSNYEDVKLYQSTYKNSAEFFANRVFKRADWEVNLVDRFNTCYVISIHTNNTPIHRQLNKGSNEIHLDMNYLNMEIDTEGIYEYLLNINESEYETLGNNQQFNIINGDINENISVAYIRLISQNERPTIMCGESYTVDELYGDYTNYAKSNNIKPEDKTVFGKTCKKYGILRKRVKSSLLLYYKYFIPAHIDFGNL